MPRKMVVIDYNKCQPERCNSGLCSAALACPKNLLKQEAPFQPPMPDPSICKGCAECVLACPLKAVRMS